MAVERATACRFRLASRRGHRLGARNRKAGIGRKRAHLLRPSGTEPLLRVMVEGRDGVQVKRLAQEIAAAVEKAAAA
jgi:phosphoglucosamine mutase